MIEDLRVEYDAELDLLYASIGLLLLPSVFRCRMRNVFISESNPRLGEQWGSKFSVVPKF